MTKLEAVDIFCGVGGLSLGLADSGIKVVGGIDADPACAYPYEKNIRAPFINADVAEISGSDIEPLFSGNSPRLLAGCAPCQPFSRYNAGRQSAESKWQLLDHFMRLIDELQPELVTLENVPDLRRLAVWEKFVAELRSKHYQIAWAVLDASLYGVPQSRKRLVLLASRLGTISLPPPDLKQVRSVTVKAAIGRLPPLGAGEAHPEDPLHCSRLLTSVNLARIRASVPSGTWRDWPEELQVACHKGRGRTYPSVYGRMSWGAPSPTITTQFYGFGNGRFGHPEQDRALTLREGALLQSFPRNFSFLRAGARVNFRELGRLIGNAVPPRLACAIGTALRAHVEDLAASSEST